MTEEEFNNGLKSLVEDRNERLKKFKEKFKEKLKKSSIDAKLQVKIWDKFLKELGKIKEVEIHRIAELNHVLEESAKSIDDHYSEDVLDLEGKTDEEIARITHRKMLRQEAEISDLRFDMFRQLAASEEEFFSQRELYAENTLFEAEIAAENILFEQAITAFIENQESLEMQQQSESLNQYQEYARRHSISQDRSLMIWDNIREGMDPIAQAHRHAFQGEIAQIRLAYNDLLVRDAPPADLESFRQYSLGNLSGWFNLDAERFAMEVSDLLSDSFRSTSYSKNNATSVEEVGLKVSGDFTH